MTTSLMAAMAGKQMKKQLFIISILVVIVSIFVSCSANGSNDNISTTAVADSNGTTHYYEPVTDESDTTVLAEIEIQTNGSIITDKNGEYVTKKHTTLPNQNAADNTVTTKSSAEQAATDDIQQADNVVEFEPTETTEKTEPDTTTTEKETKTTTTETTTQKETQPATDKDGWITKWY